MSGMGVGGRVPPSRPQGVPGRSRAQAGVRRRARGDARTRARFHIARRAVPKRYETRATALEADGQRAYVRVFPRVLSSVPTEPAAETRLPGPCQSGAVCRNGELRAERFRWVVVFQLRLSVASGYGFARPPSNGSFVRPPTHK